MNPAFAIYDAHNHFQDERLNAARDSIAKEVESFPIRAAVVNGTRPADWPAVSRMAENYKWVVPSYGLHPWYVTQNCENWKGELEQFLQVENAAVGEIGLDRWIEGFDSQKQEEAFVWQLRLAAQLQRPVTIHCLKAWGRLLEILENERLPSGFLLHSYGGPAEMIRSFVALGGYFSLSGYFAHERKQKQREAFRAIPPDRFLLETDAPDMLPPEPFRQFDLPENLNHPANILTVYHFAAELFQRPVSELATQVENNFKNLFGALLAR